jgi:hypothetical protein
MTTNEFKAATLANNVVWLRAFGCNVETAPGLVRIRSSPIASYVSAVAVTRMAAFTLLSEQNKFYVDLNAVGIDELDSYGYSVIPRSCSTIVGGTIQRQLRVNPEVTIVLAPNSDAWSSMYVRAFVRSDAEASMDRERWRRAFRSTAVEHWTVFVKAQPVGVFQTVAACGVTGLYSFGILPSHRSVRTQRSTIDAIHHLFHERQWAMMYYEVFERADSASVRAAPRLGLRVLRRMCGFAPSLP